VVIKKIYIYKINILRGHDWETMYAIQDQRLREDDWMVAMTLETRLNRSRPVKLDLWFCNASFFFLSNFCQAADFPRITIASLGEEGCDFLNRSWHSRHEVADEHRRWGYHVRSLSNFCNVSQHYNWALRK